MIPAPDLGAAARPRGPKLMFVGAFPAPDSRVMGGNVADCRALLASSFPNRVELVTLDSSRQGPARLWTRLRIASRRAVRFLRMFHGEEPDAMLLFASFGFSFAEKALYAAYARAHGVPALLSLRSGHFMDQCRRSLVFRVLARALLAAPARLVCQGRQWQDFYSRTFGLPPARCPIVDAWVATEDLLELGRIRPRERKRVTRFLFLGNLVELKGVLDLLEAVRRMKVDPDLPEFEVVFGGEGALAGELKRRTAAYGLSSVVQLPGQVVGAAKLEAFRAADVFVLPSRTEGLPNAMIEAMAAGLPVVVTPVGSIPDVVVDGENGFLVPPGDVSALERVLHRLLTSPEARDRAGRAAHALAAARHSTEQAAVRIEHLVREVIAEAKPRGRGAAT